jgi:hypothetical protein
MTVWFPEYVSVKNPEEDRRGWRFPFAGDDWPETDDWYWVWAGGKNHPAPRPSTPPKIAWWDGSKQRFLAMEGDVYAWRKTEVIKNSKR